MRRRTVTAGGSLSGAAHPDAPQHQTPQLNYQDYLHSIRAKPGYADNQQAFHSLGYDQGYGQAGYGYGQSQAGYGQTGYGYGQAGYGSSAAGYSGYGASDYSP